LLRSLKQASYDAVNIGHFGLASEAYLHFTSPIRRYPDLLVHRLVKQVLRGKRPVESAAATEALRTAATQSSARERAAMSVEREIVDLYRALLGRRLLGEIFEGRVSALVGGGVFVSVDNPFIEVMIPYEGMGPDRYELSEDELSFVGSRSGDTLGLGDTVSVEIVDSSILRRQVYGRRIVHFSEGQGDRRAPQRGRSSRSGQAQPRGSAADVRKGKGKRPAGSAGSAETPAGKAAQPSRFGKGSTVTPSRSKSKPKSRRRTP
jgi:ribonuclease R